MPFCQTGIHKQGGGKMMGYLLESEVQPLLSYQHLHDISHANGMNYFGERLLQKQYNLKPFTLKIFKFYQNWRILIKKKKKNYW